MTGPREAPEPAEPSLPQWAGVVETHTGAVFFAGDVAIKVRKPVRLPFIDLSRPQLRRQAAYEEVRLNRRLAPDVYLGVAELTLPGVGPEAAVVMRRLPGRARLSGLVSHGAPGLEDVVRILARRLVDFHAECPARPDVGDVGQLRALWDDVRSDLTGHCQFVRPDVLDRVHRRAMDYLAGRAPLFAERVEQGCVRDGHGDLLADDIFVLDDGPRILDCLDFDERLRCGDVLLDVAFLAMDLEHLGAPDLARLLLDRYRELSGRPQPPSLEHFFIAYRAAVRAKVTAIRWEQGAAGVRPEVEALLDLADRHLEAAAARVVLVGGLPGSGKTTLARHLADEPGWVLLSTDAIRPGPRGDAGRYTTPARERVYDDLLVRARASLGAGASVVLDATWQQETWRQRARAVAADAHAAVEEICCVADDETARTRLGSRTGDASEAGEPVRRLLARTFAPWPQARIHDGGIPVRDFRP
jgi:aminoglycoside phosphotransferase family enzyme